MEIRLFWTFGFYRPPIFFCRSTDLANIFAGLDGRIPVLTVAKGGLEEWIGLLVLAKSSFDLEPLFCYNREPRFSQMSEQEPIKSPPPFALWVAVMGVTCFACYLGNWYLYFGGGKISLMWPAAGVAMAFFVRYGWKITPAVLFGHLVIWTFIPPSRETWPIILIPFTYTLEAWFIGAWGYCNRKSVVSGAPGMWPVAWSYLGAPILCCLPCSLITTISFTMTGRFPSDSMVMSFVLIVMAHIHGVVTFGTLTLHLLDGDFNVPDVKKSPGGIIVGLAALLVMTLAFTGKFDGILSATSAIYLPFPLLVMAAVWLPPAPISVLIALWCVLSTALTSLGLGPFEMKSLSTEEIMNPAELGLYNIVMASVAYLVSAGSSSLQRQLNLNEVALNAAGIGLWEWEAGRGFSWVQGRSTNDYLCEKMTGLSDVEALRALGGGNAGSMTVDDSWRTRIQEGDLTNDGEVHGLLLESVGKVLQRGQDHQPIKAIGLIQDLSALQKADEALVALGYQKAKLRALQAKLNPHFLFNSLNVIRALVHIDTKTAHEAITSLAGLLRSSLRTTESSLIDLKEELENIRAFLHLAGLRFGSRLESRIRVPADLLATRVPPMLLLNLVENAMTHGIGNCEEGGMISLTASHTTDEVRISVRNTGTLSASAIRGTGIRDALQRLELLYAGKARFSLSQADARTVTADVFLPIPQPRPHEFETSLHHVAHH